MARGAVCDGFDGKTSARMRVTLNANPLSSRERATRPLTTSETVILSCVRACRFCSHGVDGGRLMCVGGNVGLYLYQSTAKRVYLKSDRR